MLHTALHLRTLAALFAALALAAAGPAAATASKHHHRHHARHHVCHIPQGAHGTDNDSDNHGGPSDGDGCI